MKQKIYFVKMICWNNVLTFMNMSKRVVMRINNKCTVSISNKDFNLLYQTGLSHSLNEQNTKRTILRTNFILL